MWWLWPHLRRLWAGVGTMIAGLTVTYVYNLWSKQAVPDLRSAYAFLHDYWLWAGGALIALGSVSIAAERSHRRHDARAPQLLRVGGRSWSRRVSGHAEAVAVPATQAGTMVGRTTELAKLYNWFAQVKSGARHVIFVAGEPGIGKTTLTRAFLDSLAGDRRIRIGRGQCVEQYGAGEPYMPILEALTRLCREPGGEKLVEILHRLAPAWLVQMPSLVSAEDRTRLQNQAQGTTQQRMLREMAEALEVIARERPLILFLEDLHWSDPSTLDLVAMVARRNESARLMILGTYRPVEMLAGEHPLRALKEELEVHQQCAELRLRLLSEADVAAYLAQRFGEGKESGILRFAQNDKKESRGSDNPQRRDEDSSSTLSFRSERSAASAQRNPGSLAQIASLIYQRTDGNALFMVNVVDYLVAQGPSLDATKIETPRNIRQMIERNLRRLDAESQAVLESASVAGAEFSAAAVAAALERPVGEIEACCTRLSGNEQFVRAEGASAWPDGTIALNIRFLHALYREVLYDRVPPGHRVELHRRIAAREETAYAERAPEIAAELANHYSRANDEQKAIQYFQLAGQRAAARGAMVEAAHQYTAALELLKEMPEIPERDRRELDLQLAVGPTLIATKGFGATETERAYTRARQLCQQLGDPPELFPTLFGLWHVHFIQGQFRKAYELAEELLRRAQGVDDPAPVMYARYALGTSSLLMAEFLPARQHYEIAITLYDPERHGPLAFRYLGVDFGVPCLFMVGQVLWVLGYPDQALKRSNEALALAQDLSHAFSLASAKFFVGVVRQYRREARAAQENAEGAIALCAEQGFTEFLGYATSLRGWAITAQGRREDGIQALQEGLAAFRATGAVSFRPYFLCLLAETYMETSRFNDGLSALTEALAAVDQHENHFYEAEIHRLKGELLLKQDDSKAAEAQRCLEQAIEVARRQSAKSLELRATTSLARLFHDTGRRDKARTMLAEIYNWFTEGFDTADLQDARALLESFGLRDAAAPRSL
jgi:predicted ATPase